MVEKAAFKSAFKSSTSSIPTDKRIKSLVTPALSCSTSDNCWCVVLAGWIMSDLVSPIFANNENTLVASAIDFADSYPPLVPKVTIPLCPFGKYLSANDLYLLLSKPG